MPTAALDWQREGPLVRNVRIQDLCPLRLTDHLTIGTTDRVAQEVALDAFTQPGPADPARLALTPLCTLPDQYTNPAQLTAIVEQVQRSFDGGFGDWHTVDEEPPLKPYAEASLHEDEDGDHDDEAGAARTITRVRAAR